MKKSLPLNPMHLGLCIPICLQVQNFVELVQESWLALAILAKALQKHYVNTLTPPLGDNATSGCMARSGWFQLLTVIFSLQIFIFHLPERYLASFHQGLKFCWETIHKAVSMEQWMCHQLCLSIVSSLAEVGVKLCKVVWPSREV